VKIAVYAKFKVNVEIRIKSVILKGMDYDLSLSTK
jgi:hypothetical protein